MKVKKFSVKNKVMRTLGLLVLISMNSFGSVPGRGGINSKITDDTVIYQKISETTEHKSRVNFDLGLNRLAKLEDNFGQEKLPKVSDHPALRGPMARIQKSKYQPKKRK